MLPTFLQVYSKPFLEYIAESNAIKSCRNTEWPESTVEVPVMPMQNVGGPPAEAWRFAVEMRICIMNSHGNHENHTKLSIRWNHICCDHVTKQSAVLWYVEVVLMRGIGVYLKGWLELLRLGLEHALVIKAYTWLRTGSPSALEPVQRFQFWFSWLTFPRLHTASIIIRCTRIKLIGSMIGMVSARIRGIVPGHHRQADTRRTVGTTRSKW